MIHKIIKNWPIIFVVILAFVLRVIKLEELFYFTYDESIPAFVGRRLILWQHIPLIGGVTPFNFHLGPYFYWFYTFILWLGKLNPIAWGWTSAFLATFTTLMIFIVGKSFASKKVGFIAATFWAFSYLTNVYDRHLWALYWGPLVSLIVIYCLYKIVKGKGKFVYLLAVVIGLSIHADPSNLAFLVLSIIVWIIYKLQIKKSTLIALGIIIFSFLPLAVFDIRHNFANTRPLLDFLKAGKNTPGFEIQKFTENSLLFPRTFTRLIYPFGDHQIAKQYSYCRSYVLEKFQAIPWYLVVLSSVILIVFVIKHLRGGRRDSPEVSQVIGFRLISMLVVLYFFGIQLHGTIFRADIFEHYITGTFAVFLLIAAFFVSKLPQKLWLTILALFVAFNLYKFLNTKNSMGLTYKRQAIEYSVQKVGDRPFSIDSLSSCWKYSGYRYLFTVFGKEPVKSYVDPNFAYLYGTTPVAQKHPTTVVAFVIHDFAPETDEFYRRYALLKSHQVESSLFGNIEVITMDNSSGWFDII